jgi:mono/diheme cytochrome c family protein
VREGARLVDAASCRRCHTIGGKGNRLATNLDGVVARREQPELAAAITAPAESMPTFGFDRGQTESIVAFLLNVARPDAPDDGYRVHFARAPARPSTVFEQRCGGCHRLLGPSGPRGTGDQGPNLSGLFTPFYPPTATGDRPWSASALAEWVGNPRALRATTTMPPVSLTAGELREVTEELGGGALPAGPS